MRGSLLISFCLLLLCANSLAEEAENVLSFEFDTPVASITPRASNRPVQFPNLALVLRAETRCPVSDSIATVSVSIADSQLTIAPDTDEQGRIEETINVSHKQLGPIVVDNFCLAESTESLQFLELEGALSAHLSLRCRGENHDSISYATTALNVAIECEDEKPESPEGDGETVAE